ncbi:hypothetical protein [Plantactinospora sp. B24E8]|uniref:hypothetical protein n=1 Tax=Plantactinospora sp. B24E8 TaxID=3153567 RepID=UPI00325D9C2B
MPDDLGPDPQTGLMPARYPPGAAPDFEAIYEYAKQWLDLGDEIYLYYINLAFPTLSLTWSGGARDKALESLEPLRRMLVDPKQDPSGQSFLSAARMVWNVGESINWYADKLQEQRKKEEAQAIKEMFLGIFMFALIFVAFIPALSFIANLMATFTRLLTAVVRMFQGAVWMQRLAGFAGGAIDGALGAFVSDKVFNDLAGNIAGTHLDEDPKNIIINVAVGAGVGGIFGLGAVGRNAPHDMPGGIGGPKTIGTGTSVSGPKNVSTGVPDVTGTPGGVKLPGDGLFSGPKLEGRGPVTVRGDGDAVLFDPAPPYSARPTENVRPGGPTSGVESPSVPRDVRPGAPRFPGEGNTLGARPEVSDLRPAPNVRDVSPAGPGVRDALPAGPGVRDVPPAGPHEPVPAGRPDAVATPPGGAKSPDAGNAQSARPDGSRFPGTGNTLGAKPGVSDLHPAPNVRDVPPAGPHEPVPAGRPDAVATPPGGPRSPDAGNVLGARPAVSDLRPAPNIRDTPPAGSTGVRAEPGGARADTVAPANSPPTRDTPPPARDLGDRQAAATSTGDGNAVSARSGSGDRPGTGQAAGNDDRRGGGQRTDGDGPVVLPGHVGPPPGAGREVIRIDPETGARDLVTIGKKPFPGTGRTLGATPGSDLHPAPNLPQGPSPRQPQSHGQGQGGRAGYEFHEIDPATGRTSPTGLGPDDVVVSAKPVDRQVFRTNVNTGERELVTLSRLPGRGNTLGAAPGTDLRPAPRIGEGASSRPGHGPGADGTYRYHEIDPHTGAATPTEVGPSEGIVRVQPASGVEQRNFVVRNGEKIPVGAPDERVLRYDWGRRQWDVDTVSPGPAPADRSGNPSPGGGKDNPLTDSPPGLQVLRRDADGNIDLLTYRRDPVRVANGRTDGFTFQELGTGRTGWHEGEYFGTPKVERVTTVPDAHRLDGTPVKLTEHGVLVRDPETRLWTPVRSGGGADVPVAPARPGGSSYYRATPEQDGLTPAGVKGDPLPVIKVRGDGSVETSTFSPSGDSLPQLRVGRNGELLNSTPNGIRPEQLSFDPKSGNLTFREPTPYEAGGGSGGSGGGSGGGPGGSGGPGGRPGGPGGGSGGSGGGPARGGGGLGQRPTGTGSQTQTQTETRTITFTEDKPPQVGDRTHGGGPEDVVGEPKPVGPEPVPNDGGMVGGGRPDSGAGTRTVPAPAQRPAPEPKPALPESGSPQVGPKPEPVSSPVEGGGVGGRPSREQLAAAAQQRMNAGTTPVDDSALVVPKPESAGAVGVRPVESGPVSEPGRQVFRVDPVTGERDLVTLSVPRERFPQGGGDTLGAQPGTVKYPAPRSVGAGPAEGVGASRGAGGRGGYEYVEVDPRTGVETRTSVHPDESVLRVQPVGGNGQGASGQGGGRSPVGEPTERVAVFDSRTGRWDVTTVSAQPASSGVESRNYHVVVPRGRTLAEPVPEPPTFQVLRGDTSGNVDLLTFDRPPVRVPEPDAGAGSGYRYFELEAGRWYEGRFDGTPSRMERVTTVGPRGHRLDGQPVEVDPGQNRVLVRDPVAGRWGLVRNDRPQDAAAVEPVDQPVAGGLTYFRPGDDGTGLRPVGVRSEPLRVVRVDAHGGVSMTTFSPSGGTGSPQLHLDADGVLVGAGPDRVPSDQLVFDPGSGRLTFTQSDASGTQGSGGPSGGSGDGRTLGGSGGGPARGGSGGGPARGGGGLGQRPAGTGSQTQTQTETRTITFTEDKPPRAGGRPGDDLPEPVVRPPAPAESGTVEQPRDVADGDGPEMGTGGSGAPEGTHPVTPSSLVGSADHTPSSPVDEDRVGVPIVGGERPLLSLEPLLHGDPLTTNRRLADDPAYATDVITAAWSHPDATLAYGRSYALLPAADLPRFITVGQGAVQVSTDRPRSVPDGHQLLVFDSYRIQVPYGDRAVTLVTGYEVELLGRTRLGARFVQPPDPDVVPPAGARRPDPSVSGQTGPQDGGSAVTPSETATTPSEAADTRMLDRINSRVTGEITNSGGDDLLADLFTARYPAGARLPGGGDAGQDIAWRADSAAEGPGWQRVASWQDVAAAAGQAGRGGFALVRLEDTSRDAVGVHVGRDGTLWIVHVRPGTDPVYHRFDEAGTAGLPDPVRVAVLDYCADVRSAT